MLKNALRNRRRSLLTVFSIGASLCLLGVLFAIYRALYLAPPPQGQELRLITHHKVSITQGMPSSYAARIRRVPGVRDAMVWQWFGGTYKDARESSNFFARFAVEPDRFFNVRPEIQMPDEQKQGFQKLRTGAIASDDLVKKMNWKLGERILLTGDIFPVNPELTLVGTFNDPATTQTLFFSREYLRELMKAKEADSADWVGMFQVQAESPEVVTRVGRDIDALFANASEATKTESEQAFDLQFAAFLGNIKVYLMSVCAAVTFTILLVSANTMAMSVRERVARSGHSEDPGLQAGCDPVHDSGRGRVIAIIGGAFGLALAASMDQGVRSRLHVWP